MLSEVTGNLYPFEIRQRLEEFINLRTMENINIAELLKNVPKYYELRSPVWGKVLLYNVKLDSDFPIEVCSLKINEQDIERLICLTKNGHYSKNKGAECILFPANGCTWKNFEWEGYKTGDIIVNIDGRIQMVSDGFHHTVYCSYAYEILDKHILAFDLTHDPQIFARYASPDEKNLLLTAIEENGYQLTSNGLIGPNHKGFRPFDKVLIANANAEWVPAIYERWNSSIGRHMVISQYMTDVDDKHIISYEGNETLVGKKAK